MEQTEWDLAGSHVRISSPKPKSPATTGALNTIQSDFADNAFRAFHATRLLAPDSVLEEGLWALDRKKQISRVRAAAANSTSSRLRGRVAAWGNWSEETDEIQSGPREGNCWLTPSRRFLHDGALDLMFERFGGEFIERISGDPFDGAQPFSSDSGRPMIVVASIPTSWCRWTPDMGSRRILYEVLGSLGHRLSTSFAGFWDVQVGHDIPPDRIEYVCPRADMRVADPREGV